MKPVNSAAAITVTQNMFMLNGSRWSPKGLCYQPTDNVDPLSDDNLDIITSLLDPSTTYGLKNLGINCLRVYQVDPTKPHGKVMQLLADNNIYVLVGAVTSTTCITTVSKSLAPAVVARVQAVADAFSGYNNVLGFDISNELLDSSSPSEYGLVSLTKQLKQQLQTYMASKNYRAIPIGCCLRDDPDYTFPASDAYVCGSASERMDFLGYNTYRWVVQNGTPPSQGTLNQYYLLYNQYKQYPVPVMLTETGAACQGGRDWSEIAYTFGQKQVSSLPPNQQSATLSDAISGCFAFIYHDQGGNWGLVKSAISADPQPVTTGEYGGYDALSTAYKNVTSFPGTPDGIDKEKCSSLSGNPYAGNTPPASGGLPTATTVTLTNAITNPSQGRTVSFSYATVANPGGNDWIPVEPTIPPLGPPMQFTFPAGTQAISMSFDAGNGQWPRGCWLQGAALLKLKNNDTIQGQFVGDGNGSCPVI